MVALRQGRGRPKLIFFHYRAVGWTPVDHSVLHDAAKCYGYTVWVRNFLVLIGSSRRTIMLSIFQS